MVAAGVVLAAVAPGARAAPLAPAEVPAPLKPWIGWVLHGHETARCPGDDDERLCAWAGRLELALDDRGGRFGEDVEAIAETAVALPGDASRWPFEVKVDGKPAIVISDDGKPTARLPPGRHRLTGAFAWKRLPESLPVPPEAGLIALTVRGRAIAFPGRGEGDELFLQAEAKSEADADALSISVHRKITDDVPLMLETRLQLAVAGKMREVVLGRALPDGFVPHALHGELPTRLEPDGRMRVQLRPGNHTITLVGRQPAGAKSITRPEPGGLWKDGEEVWVFEARPSLRLATVEGVPAIDPRQTTLPADWQSLPAYVMAPHATLGLREQRRGDAEPAPDRLRLQRHLWLDFDGGGYSVRDEVSGSVGRSWRLDMGSEEVLGHVAAGGVDQFITRAGAGAPSGVELRQTDVSLRADGRIEGRRGDIAAVSWAHDFDGASATLSVPPGWQVLHVSGADAAGPTWIKMWTLLDLFLALLVALATAKLFGPRAGLLALVTLGLIMQEEDAPRWIWLAVLLGEALCRALPEGRLRRLAQVARLGAGLVLIVLAVPFAVTEVRAGLHPGLGARGEVSFLARSETTARMKGFAQQAADTPAAEETKPGFDAPEGKEDEKNEVLGVTGGVRKLEKRGGFSSAIAQNLTSYDPSVQVQTGPGVPRWSWSDVTLTWNGPLDQNARLSLWLIPPRLSSLLAFARVALLALLALVLVRRAFTGFEGFGGRPAPPVAAAVALLVALAGGRAARAADTPDDKMLDALREALLADPACAPDCASFGRLAVEATPGELRLRLEASAAARAVVALPGRAEHWSPSSVLVDGKAVPALRRGDEGALLLLLPPGAHQVVLEGPLPGRQTVQIPFGPLRPHAVTSSLHGWTLDGIDEDGAVGEALQLTRTAAAAAAGGGDSKGIEGQSLPPFLSVERTLRLGLKWEVETRVRRATPPGAAAVLEVPLLPGESVLTEGVKVVKGKAQVNMGPAETETVWRSVLSQVPALALAAPRLAEGGVSWAEVWRLELGPIWHATLSGIPPVHPGDAGGLRAVEWRPWPGESIRIDVSRPSGTPGQTLTVDASTLELRPGERSAAATLTIALRSSRGGQHPIALPEGAVLEQLRLDGHEQPLRQEGRQVLLRLDPGAHQAEIGFRTATGAGTLYRTPEVDLGTPSVNADLVVGLQPDRMVLFVGGPRLGPAVLIWSALVVVLVVGALLGRSRMTPLRARHFILLGLGFAPFSLVAAIAVVSFFFALGWRRERFRARRGWVHDLVQVGLAAFMIVVVVLLVAVVRDGLLARPDMQIEGHGSDATTLRWFADRAPGPLPGAWVVSVPLVAYHIARLAWALWLAAALTRWARWAWSCFAEESLWRRLSWVREPPAPPPAPVPPAG
jgi:hypothetical protein